MDDIAIQIDNLEELGELVNRPESSQRLLKFKPVLNSVTTLDEILDVSLGVLKDDIAVRVATHRPNPYNLLEVRAFNKILKTKDL